jgi:hypothetical protein
MSAKLERSPFWGLKQPVQLKHLQQVFNKKSNNIDLNRTCLRDLLKRNLFIFQVKKIFCVFQTGFKIY